MGQLRRSRGFMLLEVMVAIVIIGVSVVALFRGFIVTLDSVNRLKQNEQAIFLARTFMDDMILEPPAEGTYEGRFAEDSRFGEDWEGWKWKLRVDRDEPRYQERPKGTLLQDIEEIYTAEVEILFEPVLQSGSRGHAREISFITVQTILMDPELFSQEALQTNQLF